MNPEQRYRRAKEVFLEVCDLKGPQRDTTLRRLCTDDAQLIDEVVALLRHDAEPGAMDGVGGRAPGDRIGRYTIVRALGTGSMGVVYEAQQDHPHRTVAIKISRLGMNSASLRDRLAHEVAALARLQHPGIAAMHDAGVDEVTGEPYFVMELVRGVPITQYADTHRLSIPDRVELLACVCDAVHHAHLRGVIHRDLKPSNILVDESGRARVLDFGIARLEGSEDFASTTLPGQVIGTVGYMSPEQAGGDPDAIDARTDIYALGSILFELLTGRLPLPMSGRPIHDAVRAIRDDQPPRMGSLDRRLRGDPETIAATALEKRPDQRYQSAASLGGDLRRSLRDEPIIARPPTTLYQLVKFARRRRGLVVAVGTIAAILVAASAISTAFAFRAESERARAARRFDQVRALANTFIFDINDRIETLPGSLDARRSLVQTGLTYLDSLADEADDNPALLAELAQAYSRIGDLQGNPRRSNLGEVDAALKSYARSTAIRERIERVAPSPANRLAMARTLIVTGEATTSSDLASHAIDDFTRARDLLGAMLRGNPGDPELLASMGLAEGRIGGVLRDMGRLEDALTHFQASLDAAQRVADIDPTYMRALSIAHNETGQTLMRLDRPLEALPHFERSMEIRAAAVAAAPGSARAQRDLALVHQRLADVYRATGDAQGALAHDQAALGTLAALQEADPADARSRFDLAVAYEKVANSLTGLDRLEDALDASGQSLALRQALAREHPENLLYAKVCCISQGEMGEALRALDRHKEAQERYRASIESAQRCNETDPADARIWTALAYAQRGLGESSLTLAEHDAAAPAMTGPLRRAAADWFRASLETLGHMEEHGLTPVRDSINRAELDGLLARCQPPGTPGHDD